MIFKKSSLKKRGVVGIETLIIFIAMILVAGVAAFVLIRTSGLLQQRALAVSNEAITRVSTSFEFIQVIGNTNPVSEELKEFEILLRLGAGSNAIQMNNVGLTFISGLKAFTATLSHENYIDFESVQINYTDNATTTALYNLDVLTSDKFDDTVVFVPNGTGVNESLSFDLSTAGNFTINLQVDLDASDTFNKDNIPILGPDGETIYGFIDFNGTIKNYTGSINNSLATQNFTLLIKKYPDSCEFSQLRPEINYCLSPQIGDNDNKFEPGELLILKYKLTDDSKLGTDEAFEFNLVPKTGVIATLSGRTAEAFMNYKTLLWP